MQLSLVDSGAPRLDLRFSRARRVALSPRSWIEHAPRWLGGHERVVEALADRVAWQETVRPMYERTVRVPRLVARLDPARLPHPSLARARRALEARYGVPLASVGAAWYRHGGDSVAWHGDRVRDRDDSLVAILSLGTPRTLAIRPAGGGRATRFSLGWGDLFVMGGATQREFEHRVPKRARADARMSVMFRWSA
ncbi:MAG TPA: alpha-ketoglutarate-dependent dioxygenase AlkB [Sandaracinaceae bacterium LLY-WYZ-13_1]|nr:alpha-ketoglutarate-dependent dioxygenase AlkB [Sandaracinaceae bacterium LLY-WYZ-13_1]